MPIILVSMAERYDNKSGVNFLRRAGIIDQPHGQRPHLIARRSLSKWLQYKEQTRQLVEEKFLEEGIALEDEPQRYSL